MRFLSGSKILYFVTLFFVTASAGLFWLESFRASEAELDILVKERTALHADPAAALGEIAGTLRFADALAEEPGLGDLLPPDVSADRRKARWQERFSATAVPGGVLSVRLRAQSQEEARLLASGFVKEFLGTASRYYDVEREIDVRVVDGPVFSTAVRTPLLYALVTLATGFIVTSGFFALLFGIGQARGSFERKAEPERLPIGDAVPWIDPSKFVPVKPRTLAYDEAGEIDRPETESPESEALQAPAEGAPANLPVMDEVPAFEFEPAPSAAAPVTEERTAPEPAPSSGEPSTEEYKRRLNELLQGKNL